MLFNRRKNRMEKQPTVQNEEKSKKTIEIEDRGVPFIVLYADGNPRFYGMNEFQVIGVLESELEYFRMWRKKQFEEFLNGQE